MVKANRARRVIALAGDEKIRNLTLSEPARERVSMQVTGTDGQHISERFAEFLPSGDDGNGRDNSDTDGMMVWIFNRR